MRKNSKGNLTISLSKRDTNKLNDLARAMSTSRENVIRGLIREGHAYTMKIGRTMQRRMNEQEEEFVQDEDFAG